MSEQAQAIYESWFVSFEKFGGMVPLDWGEGVLGDIAEIRLTMEKNYASIINKKSAYRHRRGGIRNGRRQLYFL